MANKKNKDVNVMTAEELDVYEKSLDAEYMELNKKRNDLSKRMDELKEARREIKRRENNEKLEFYRKNKDVILKIVATVHTRSSCSDSYHCNDYLDNGYPECKRCMLLRILDEDWEDSYEINFDVTFEEI